jgi:Co/Zn/Cd efflux system component
VSADHTGAGHVHREHDHAAQAHDHALDGNHDSDSHGHPHANGHGRGHDHDHDHDHDIDHDHGGHGHGHSHGLIDRSIVRSRDGLRTVALSLGVLLATAILQGVIFLTTASVALLADLIHNFGDALTAVPLGIAFAMRSFVAEKRAGYFVVATIFVSACVAAYTAVDRLLHPQALHHLGILALAGLIGFAGNELAAQIRLRAGARLSSPALIADGNHARTDGFVSLAVVASSIVVALGLRLGDPIIGLTITLVILRITWQSFQTIRTHPGPADEPADGDHARSDGHPPGHGDHENETAARHSH